jgi:hypothetical protein
MDDVMPGGRDGDENGRAVLAHLRLQAHLYPEVWGSRLKEAAPRDPGQQVLPVTDTKHPKQCCGSGIVLVRIRILLYGRSGSESGS